MHRRVGDAARSDLVRNRSYSGITRGTIVAGLKEFFLGLGLAKGGIENQERGAFTDWRIKFLQIFLNFKKQKMLRI